MIGKKYLKYLLNIIVDIVGAIICRATAIGMTDMKQYSKPILKKGQAFCEGCGLVCIEWSIKPILVDGQFFNLCKKCQSLHSKGELLPLCYQNQNAPPIKET